MSRPSTVFFAAIEAAVAVGIGVAIPVLALTLMWAFSYGLAPDWGIFWRAGVDSWLIGNGVEVRFTLDALLAGSLGLTGAAAPFTLSITALGFATLTLLLGVRSGTRIAASGHRILGLSTGVITVAALGLALTLSAQHRSARPSLWQGALLPTLVFGVGVLIALAAADARDADGSIRRWLARLRPPARAALLASVRGGLGAASLSLAGAAVLLAGAFVVNYATLVKLYQALSLDVPGSITLTLGQLAFVPNLVVWMLAWCVGPGFALGAGSSVSPLGTAVGPTPALPLLGAIPTDAGAAGYLGLVVPVVAAFFAGVAVRRGMNRAARVPEPHASEPNSAPEPRAQPTQISTIALAALGSGVVGGLVVGVLSAAAGGAAGPGRLAQLGPDPWLTGAVAALEFAIGVAIGMLVSGERDDAASDAAGGHEPEHDTEPIDGVPR